MEVSQKPYFMNDSSWYYYDMEEFCYKLTDKAPEKARESYKEFYKMLEDSYTE